MLTLKSVEKIFALLSRDFSIHTGRSTQLTITLFTFPCVRIIRLTVASLHFDDELMTVLKSADLSCIC